MRRREPRCCVHLRRHIASAPHWRRDAGLVRVEVDHRLMAQTMRRGRFEQADGGTLFLDEIGEAPLALQAKLLRALQPDLKGRRYIRAVGAVSQQQISCRIIAATKKDLFACVLDNTFREDLYGRLMSYEIELTGLSHRPGDIPLILRHLGCDDTDDLDTPYWQKRIELMNVRALQAYALRKKL